MCVRTTCGRGRGIDADAGVVYGGCAGMRGDIRGRVSRKNNFLIFFSFFFHLVGTCLEPGGALVRPGLVGCRRDLGRPAQVWVHPWCESVC